MWCEIQLPKHFFVEWIKFLNKCITLTIHHTKPIRIINRLRLLYIIEFNHSFNRFIWLLDHEVYNLITLCFRYQNCRNFDKNAWIQTHYVWLWGILLPIIYKYYHGKSIILSIQRLLHKRTLASFSKQYEASPLKFISNIRDT